MKGSSPHLPGTLSDSILGKQAYLQKQINTPGGACVIGARSCVQAQAAPTNCPGSCCQFQGPRLFLADAARSSDAVEGPVPASVT